MEPLFHRMNPLQQNMRGTILCTGFNVSSSPSTKSSNCSSKPKHYQNVKVSRQFTCSDQDWLLFGTSCYKIGDTLDYLAATTACSDLGGFIIMPKTTEEMDIAISLQKNLLMYSDGTIQQVWIGFNKISSNGTWKWADGSELNKLN
ncbi:Hypothetical predicted protein, partial [Mytilus galloprovincialis]